MGSAGKKAGYTVKLFSCAAKYLCWQIAYSEVCEVKEKIWG